MRHILKKIAALYWIVALLCALATTPTQARIYDPAAGRFMSRDPLGTVDGPNVYGFCGGDPVNCTDPMGTDWVWNAKAQSWSFISGTPYVPYPDRVGNKDGEIWTDPSYVESMSQFLHNYETQIFHGFHPEIKWTLEKRGSRDWAVCGKGMQFFNTPLTPFSAKDIRANRGIPYIDSTVLAPMHEANRQMIGFLKMLHAAPSAVSLTNWMLPSLLTRA